MRTRPEIPDDEVGGGDFPLIEPGDYDFEVEAAEPKRSSSGNDMIALTLKVWDGDGMERKVWDYLVDTDKAEWKTRHFCRSTNMMNAYESGELSADMLIGAAGKCRVNVQKGKPNPAGGMYSDKNVVRDYLFDEETKPSLAEAMNATPSTTKGRSTPPDDKDEWCPI